MSGRRLKNISKRGGLLKFGLFLYLICCLFGIVSLRTAVFNLEYELGELNMLRVDLLDERKLVAAERASFYSSAKIEDLAIKKLGMKLPERENVFFVKQTVEAGPYRASLK